MNPNQSVNNAVYDELGERWYTAQDDPVALLRAESKLRNPWVIQRIHELKGGKSCRVLDVGCGGGFLSNPLALAGHDVVGVDLSEQSLEVARRYDKSGRVHYQLADAYELPFSAKSFDVVCAMDFLEHVEDPSKAIAEFSRVLKPGGLFFFHTFNRNLLSKLVAIKFVEWFVRNTPDHLHILRLFVRPSELRKFCAQSGLNVLEMRGVRPQLFRWALIPALLKGSVPKDFSFSFSSSLLVGYCGIAQISPADSAR